MHMAWKRLRLRDAPVPGSPPAEVRVVPADRRLPSGAERSSRVRHLCDCKSTSVRASARTEALRTMDATSHAAHDAGPKHREMTHHYEHDGHDMHAGHRRPAGGPEH